MSSKTIYAFGGFSALPVSYRSSQHVIYLRAQSGTSTGDNAITWPEGRTLFMVNLPPDATDREVAALFRSCGTLERVIFDSDASGGLGHEGESSDEENEENEGDDADEDEEDGDVEMIRKRRRTTKDGDGALPRPPKVTPLPSRALRRLHRTGHSVHVIFLDTSSCTRALALATPPTSSSKTPAPTPRPWPTDTATPTGLAHYTTLYESLRPPLDVVLAHANTSIAFFDFEQGAKKRALQRESKYRKGEAIVDEDGFTLVTRGGAYGKAVGGGVGVASKKFTLQHAKGARAASQDKGRKRKHTDSKEKDAFYAFQIHETKRKALMDLKKKWEKDKAAVEKLKASRKFKPY